MAATPQWGRPSLVPLAPRLGYEAAVAAFQLFHLIAHPGSARARKYVSDHELLAAVTFRNVVYEEALAALKSRGGSEHELPALWDGERLHVGAEAVIARLAAHSDIGRG